MKRSEAARYARWSAAVAGLLALLTAGVYVKRAVKARIERRLAPARAALNIARESEGVKFSKGEGDHKEFTVEASKSTDFKDRDLTELESVVITIFGKNGERHDVIRTNSCQYTKTNGDVVCSGEVQMDLQSAADFSRADPPASPVAQRSPGAPPPQVMHVETKAVTFNRASGFALTASPVAFVFPSGNGKGIGMEYRSEIGTVKLLHDVQLELRAPEPAASRSSGKPAARANSSAASALSPGEEVTVRGASLDFDRNSRVMHVLGPASAQSKNTRLTAGELTMDLDPQFRAHQLLASGSVGGELPRIISQSKIGSAQMSVSGERLTAQFAPEGWVSSVNARGHVRGLRDAQAQRDDAKADEATATMWPRTNEIKELDLRGNVNLKTVQLKPGRPNAAQQEAAAASSAAGDDARTLTTSALRIQFSGGPANEVSRPVKAETLAAGRVEWNDSSGGDFSLAPARPARSADQAPSRSAQASALLAQSAKGAAGALNANVNETGNAAHTTLSADKLLMKFGALGKARELLADGHVETDRTAAGKPAQTATAAKGVAQLLAAGGWSQMDLDGDVHLREGDRSGQSDHAVFWHAEQTATLTGRALVRDATTETAAAKIIFAQNTGDIHAEGGVRSSDVPGHRPTLELAPLPTHITAESLQGNSQSGRALYAGHARMWQGESVLEADSIELLRDTRVLTALNNVRAVFPQSAGSATTAQTPAAASLVKSGAAGAKTGAAKSNLWHVTAGSLVYNDTENHAHLAKDVIARSVDQKMRAPVVDLYFTRAATATATSGNIAPAAKSAPAGAQQISKVVGTGGVVVEEAARKAVAERGVYTAADGKFVMSGGNPTLYDGNAGNTSGRQLTFFLADDTIIVDSENGSRILTKHRVDNQAN